MDQYPLAGEQGLRKRHEFVTTAVAIKSKRKPSLGYAADDASVMGAAPRIAAAEVKALAGQPALAIHTRKKRAVDAAASAPPTIITRYAIHDPSVGAGAAARSISFTSFGSTICTPSAKDAPEITSAAS